GGQPAVQRQLVDGAASQAHGLFRIGEGNSGGPLGNHEGADATGAGFRVGLGIEHDEVGFTGIGDVVLATPDAPAVLLAYRTGTHVRRVGTRRRLGQAEGTEQFAGRAARQPFLTLLLGATDEDRVGGEKVRGEGRGGGRTGGGNRLHHPAHGQATDPETTVGFGQVDTHEAQLAESLQAFGAKAFFFVIALCVGGQHVTADTLSRVDDGQFGGVDFKVHWAAPVRLSRPNTALASPRRGARVAAWGLRPLKYTGCGTSGGRSSLGRTSSWRACACSLPVASARFHTGEDGTPASSSRSQACSTLRAPVQPSISARRACSLRVRDGSSAKRGSSASSARPMHSQKRRNSLSLATAITTRP